MPVENTTPNRGYQLPDPTNDLSSDVIRLIAALDLIDTDVGSLFAALAAKAAQIHQHVFGDIPGLADAIAAKADSGHQHALGDLSDVSVAGAAIGQFLKRGGSGWQPSTPQIADVSGLQDALSNPASHTHDDRYYTEAEVDAIAAALTSR